MIVSGLVKIMLMTLWKGRITSCATQLDALGLHQDFRSSFLLTMFFLIFQKRCEFCEKLTHKNTKSRYPIKISHLLF